MTAEYPDGKIIACEKTGAVVSGGKVWSCAVRTHDASGEYGDEIDAVTDSITEPVDVCLVVRADQAVPVGC